MRGDIVVLKRSSGEIEAVAFVNDGTLWSTRFPDARAMIRVLGSLEDVGEAKLASLRKFADRQLYPEHIAGAMNGLLLTEADLMRAGFTHFVKVEEYFAKV